jgi:mandelate racemase
MKDHRSEPSQPTALRSVNTRGVLVPLTYTLGTSAAVVSKVPLLLVDLETEAGVTGRSYLFGYTRSGARAIAEHIREAVELVRGIPTTPRDLSIQLQRSFALLGVTGTVRMALSALDMALWDAIAQTAGLPLATLLGSSPRPLPAYDSRGLGLMPPQQLADEAEKMLTKGLRAVKLRLGYATLSEDLKALKAVRGRVGSDVSIMVDYNQALDAQEAIARGHALDDQELLWIEEPIRHDHYDAYRRLTEEIRTPVQIGENFNGPQGMMDALKAQACDFVMPDVARIGGVSGWMEAAGLATSAGVRMSSHLMPEISAQLLCATATGHWLEWVDWADGLLDQPMAIIDGKAMPSSDPGFGLRWDERRISHLEKL